MAAVQFHVLDAFASATLTIVQKLLQLKLVFEINLRNLQGVIHDKNNY